ncbi:MAG: LysR family transcriptional regulator, partial [Phyllobacteriaceae bacterium]|nr:LysR family transcriptional regulator [Phyllobacteriaceae bacterium]
MGWRRPRRRPSCSAPACAAACASPRRRPSAPRPALAAYRELAPEVELDLTLTDCSVDLVEEGFDVAFRIGRLAESGMIARPLRPYCMAVVAAPSDLARRGTPTHPSEFDRHDSVAFAPSARSRGRFAHDGEEVQVSPPRKVTVDSGQAVRVAALAGLGIVLQPRIL